MRWKQPEKWGRWSLCRGKVLPAIVAWKFRCSVVRILACSLGRRLKWKGEELEKCWPFPRETAAFRHGQYSGIRMGTDDVHRQPGWWGMVYCLPICGRCGIAGSQYHVRELQSQDHRKFGDQAKKKTKKKRKLWVLHPGWDEPVQQSTLCVGNWLPESRTQLWWILCEKWCQNELFT